MTADTWMLEEAGPVDRAVLRLLHGGHASLVDTGWSVVAVSDGEVVGAMTVVPVPEPGESAIVPFRIDVLPDWVRTDLVSGLLRRGIDEAQGWGAAGLRSIAPVDLAAPIGICLTEAGFSVYDTYDQCEVPLKVVVEAWDKVFALQKAGYVTFPGITLHQLADEHIPAVAALWSTLIGGQASRHVDTLQAAMGGRDVGIDPRWSRIGVVDGEVVAIALHVRRGEALVCTALAVTPPMRLKAVSGLVALPIAKQAMAEGCTAFQFEAGHRQPDTRAFIRRGGQVRICSSGAVMERLIDRAASDVTNGGIVP